jgi:cyanate lyase
VLALVAKGWTNRRIGQELFITKGTAGVHVSRILAKLGAASRGEAAAIAHQLGLDSNDPNGLGLLSSRAWFGDIRSGRADPSIPRFSATRCSTRPRHHQHAK